jgi:choline-sulfatase
MSQSQPDICLFFSDQHHARVAGYAGDSVARTPNLDRLAAEGAVFDSAYTACPLCVPARVAFMTGQAATTTGVFTNGGAMRLDQATWAHSLGAAGYETVLVGRMHFRGVDQRCGFERRLVGDCCATLWGETPEARDFEAQLRPHYAGTRGWSGCLKVVGGGGVSPVLKYDELVVAAMREELKRADGAGRPRCVLTGLYAPHFPYVAPLSLYRDYLSRVSLPPCYGREDDYTNETVESRRQRARPDTCRAARAAYYAMVENLDRQLGLVLEDWRAYLQRTGRKGVFIYLSDHGDTLGEHHLYGKQTLFEGSARIPLVIQGEGIRPGLRIRMPVSITDLCPTLCEWACAPVPPRQAGRSLHPELRGCATDATRHVFCDWHDTLRDGSGLATRMVRRGSWKYVAFSAESVEDWLFNLETDPDECHNAIRDHPDVAADLRALAWQDWHPAALTRELADRRAHLAILARWAGATGQHDRDLCLESVRGLEPPEQAESG